MSKTKDYNSDLRSNILISSIRVEEATSIALKSLLRTVKKSSKTLDNKSSSLSFKNKIDLLYDIDDLNKKEYNYCLRFSEIRNQFIHNPKCNSFNDLKAENNNLINFIKKEFPNEIEPEEYSIQKSFISLWKIVLGKMLVLNLEYRKGSQDELTRYINSETHNKFNEIYKSATQKWMKNRTVSPIILSGFTKDNSKNEIEIFESYLRLEFASEQIKILDSIVDKEISDKDIYNRRTELFKDIKSEKKTISPKTKK